MADKPVERQKFYKAILEAYEGGKRMTARECSVALLPTGLTHFGLRHECAPRITELVKMGKIETVGGRFDPMTQKTVTVYRKVCNG